MNNAAKSRSALAAIVLCLYHIDLNPNLEKVCEILKKYMRLYPKNALFQWIASNVSWKYSQLDDAVFFIKSSLNSCPTSFQDKAAFLHYEIGWFYYLKLEFQQSLDNFDLVVSNCVSLKPSGELITEETGSSLKNDDFVYLPHRACLTM